MKKTFFFAAMAALALVGCNDKTQSELTEEMLGLSGEAKIEVSFYYNQGKHEVNGVAFEGNEYVPSTVEVIATVDYSQYSNQTKGQVFKQFVATRIGEGTYALTIPAGEKKIHVEVLPKGFAAKYWNSLTESVDAYYKLAKPVEFDVLAGNSYVQKDPKNTTMAKSSEALNNEAIVEFTVSGKVTANMEKFKAEEKVENSYVDIEEVTLSNVAIKLEISNTEKDGEGNLVDARKLTYNATTNSNGEYSAVVKLFNGWDFANVEISVEPVAYTSKFSHNYKELDLEATKNLKEDNWKDNEGDDVKGWASLTDGKRTWKTIDVEGYWQGEANTIKLTKAKVELAKKESDHNLTMTFVPLQPQNVPGITEGEEYTIKAYKKADKDKETPFEHKVKQYTKTTDGVLAALDWKQYVK